MTAGGFGGFYRVLHFIGFIVGFFGQALLGLSGKYGAENLKEQ